MPSDSNPSPRVGIESQVNPLSRSVVYLTLNVLDIAGEEKESPVTASGSVDLGMCSPNAARKDLLRSSVTTSTKTSSLSLPLQTASKTRRTTQSLHLATHSALWPGLHST